MKPREPSGLPKVTFSYKHGEEEIELSLTSCPVLLHLSQINPNTTHRHKLKPLSVSFGRMTFSLLKDATSFNLKAISALAFRNLFENFSMSKFSNHSTT